VKSRLSKEILNMKSAVTLTFVVSVGAFLLTALSPQAHAQQACTEFRGIVQAELPTSYPILGTDVWGGPIYTSLGGDILIGGISGNDGDPSQHGGRGGRYRVDLCPPPAPGLPIFPLSCGDSFTYEVANSVFGFAPGKAGLGDYKCNTAKIVSGTGRFLGASGNLNVVGPFILWPDSTSPFTVRGRWNGEVNGNICSAR
jgi:hypothetical protein